MSWQQTLREKVVVVGTSLHQGCRRRLQILGAPPDSGVVFVRTDLPHTPEIRAHVSMVRHTTLATTLGVGEGAQYAEVATVEHLLAALHALGIDNARVLVDGPELPILDGSARPYVKLLLAAGLEAQPLQRRTLVVRREVRLQDGAKWARIAPAPRLQIAGSVDFDHPLIAEGPYTFTLGRDDFEKELAPARTFGFLRDVNALKAKGLARGGSLDNAVVIDEYTVLNPEGLRFADEFVRHKVLDALGDIYLFGMPVRGALRLHRSGHALNTALVRAVLADPRNYAVVRAGGRAAVAETAPAPCAASYLNAAKGLA